ncbi:hypothetical protein FQN57_003130 [Myotisia sp. PD_48]|nr:hypothetical protein FQN57_003130 [Myotisia sp. PD_48]
MPVFTEYSTSSRDLRVLPSFAAPLPRLSPTFEQIEGKHEVIISGAGPAGLMLKLLLSRYGLNDNSVLCVDSKPSVLKSGQADGLQPRTLEVLKSLGLLEEILTEGCQLWEVAFWNPVFFKGEEVGIGRTAIVPDVAIPARYPHEITIHQGRIERILEDDLLRYSKDGIQRSTKLISVRIDEEGDPEFPVVAEFEFPEGGRRTVRSKYLVGADGAHSTVRRSLGLRLEGESMDHIWGVIDFVADTDFPDIRRRTAIHSTAGSIMVIPRERIATGEYLTRLYVQVKDVANPEEADVTRNGTNGTDARTRRGQVTMESILKQAQAAMKPYYIYPKENRPVDWWAAYQIGQRMAEKFAVTDSTGKHRVFIVGDACHTHSPKAGQGMNVSMMDSYNLAWKLAYSINGLSPSSSLLHPDPILDTYETERYTIAKELIEFDRAFSSMFSGKIGSEKNGGDELTHEQFLDVFSTGNGFTSGCGIEYPENILVDKASRDIVAESRPVITGTDYLSGILRPGRRLLNVKLKRYADGVPRDIHDDLLSTGRFRVLCLTSMDLLDPEGQSCSILTKLCGLVGPGKKTIGGDRFPANLLELIAIYPRSLIGASSVKLSHPFIVCPSDAFVWKDIPEAIKNCAEMKLYSSVVEHGKEGDAYSTYGVDEKYGALAVIRPDGYVGVVSSLSEEGLEVVVDYLATCISRG